VVEFTLFNDFGVLSLFVVAFFFFMVVPPLLLLGLNKALLRNANPFRASSGGTCRGLRRAFGCGEKHFEIVEIRTGVDGLRARLVRCGLLGQQFGVLTRDFHLLPLERRPSADDLFGSQSSGVCVRRYCTIAGQPTTAQSSRCPVSVTVLNCPAVVIP
jgi:hypothetical protein